MLDGKLVSVHGAYVSVFYWDRMDVDGRKCLQSIAEFLRWERMRVTRLLEDQMIS